MISFFGCYCYGISSVSGWEKDWLWRCYIIDFSVWVLGIGEVSGIIRCDLYGVVGVN